jgi:hypothetical protein
MRVRVELTSDGSGGADEQRCKETPLTHSRALASGSEQKSSAVDCSSLMSPARNAHRLSSPTMAGSVPDGHQR